MTTMDRAFTVIELGKSTPSADIRLRAADSVEVIDMSTQSVMQLKASSVSMYRHMLRREGKSYNIVNIKECA